jgi:hypothetical protein
MLAELPVNNDLFPIVTIDEVSKAILTVLPKKKDRIPFILQ